MALTLDGIEGASKLSESGMTDQDIYAKDNILGTVSQSGGIPTGAIIERDSNVNGKYIKLADGTMICQHVLTTTSTIETAAGYLFTSESTTWTFPATFALTDPTVTSSNSSSVAIWPSWNTTKTSADVRLLSYVDIDSLRTILCTAIGRWF